MAAGGRTAASGFRSLVMRYSLARRPELVNPATVEVGTRYKANSDETDVCKNSPVPASSIKEGQEMIVHLRPKTL